MPLHLTPRQRSGLKARAHGLDPYVTVGQAGVTDAVVAEVDRALTAHGLIKVRLGVSDREARALCAEDLGARTEAAVVQRVGKIVTLWRPRPDDQPQDTP
jgi:putative YhbY family RNA-binding protein